MDQKIRSRVRGAIVGTAIGDAFGMPFEGLEPETIAKNFGYLHSMVSPKKCFGLHLPHRLCRGQWTDDTQLMLAIGESIVSKGFLDFDDIAKRHVLCLSDPRGWGGSTLSGVRKIKTGVSWWNSSVPKAAGNGPSMKVAPIGVLLGLGRVDSFEARMAILNISRMTHGDPRPAIAAIIQAGAIAQAIKYGVSGLDYLKYSVSYAQNLEFALDGGEDNSLSSALLRAIILANHERSLSEIRKEIGAGSFIVESFPFMVATVLRYKNDPEACLIELATQGGDSDTTCAMAGAILGAAHGLSAFPSRWRRPLEGYGRLIALADGLYNYNSGYQRPRILFSKLREEISREIDKEILQNVDINIRSHSETNI